MESPPAARRSISERVFGESADGVECPKKSQARDFYHFAPGGPTTFRVVLTRKGIDAMYKAYKKRRIKQNNSLSQQTGSTQVRTGAC